MDDKVHIESLMNTRAERYRALGSISVEGAIDVLSRPTHHALTINGVSLATIAEQAIPVGTTGRVRVHVSAYLLDELPGAAA